MNQQPQNNALHQTRRGGAVASRPVVEARLAGERECSAGRNGAERRMGTQIVGRTATVLLGLALSGCEPAPYAPVRRTISSGELQGRWIPLDLETGASAIRSLMGAQPPPAQQSLALHPDHTCEVGTAFARFLAECTGRKVPEDENGTCAWGLTPDGREVTLAVGGSSVDPLRVRMRLDEDPEDGELVLNAGCLGEVEYMIVRPATSPASTTRSGGQQ